MESVLSCLLLCVLIFSGAQSLYISSRLGLRTALENGDPQRVDNCLQNPVQAIQTCMKKKGKMPTRPYTMTAAGTYVFVDDFFPMMCRMVTDANDCYGELESAECKMSVPTFVKMSRQLISLICPKQTELTSLISCMNNRNFQDVVFAAVNYENGEVTQENFCTTADKKLQQVLQRARTICGEGSYLVLRENIRGVLLSTQLVGFNIYPLDYCGINEA